MIEILQSFRVCGLENSTPAIGCRNEPTRLKLEMNPSQSQQQNKEGALNQT